jgi:hypothetical protein
VLLTVELELWLSLSVIIVGLGVMAKRLCYNSRLRVMAKGLCRVQCVGSKANVGV